jgi:hypothetical protein
MILDQPFQLNLNFRDVASCVNNTKAWKDCSLKERINIKVDNLAKKALLLAHASGNCFGGCFPMEQFCIYSSKNKVTGPPKTALDEHWGRAKSKANLLTEKH